MTTQPTPISPVSHRADCATSRLSVAMVTPLHPFPARHGPVVSVPFWFSLSFVFLDNLNAPSLQLHLSILDITPKVTMQSANYVVCLIASAFWHDQLLLQR